MRALRSVPALVVAGVLLLQAAWILAVPPFRGIDEFDHVYRAAAVARGEWVADNGTAQHGRGGLVTVPPDIVEAAHRQCAVLKYTGRDNCNPAEVLSDGSVRVASGASQYNPILYWYLGSVARPFHGAAADYAMRIAAAVVCALAVGACAWLLERQARRTWRRWGLLLALTPVVLYTMVLPAGNGLEIAAGLVLWCGLLNLSAEGRLHGDRRVIVLVALAAAVLVTVRSLGPIFAVLIVACAMVARRGELGAILRAHRRGLAIAAGTTVIFTLASASWVLAQAPLEGDREAGYAQVHWTALLSVPLLNVLQCIDVAPARNEPGPLVVYPVYLAALALLVILALKHSRGFGRRGLVVALVVTQAVPLVISAAALHSLGLIWQGRYALAFTGGVAVLAGVLLDRARRPPLGSAAFASWVVLVGLAQVVAVVHVIEREAGRLVSAGDAGWFRVSSLTIGVLAALGWLLLAWAVRPRRRPNPHEETPVAPASVPVGDGVERAADGWPWRPPR